MGSSPGVVHLTASVSRVCRSPVTSQSLVVVGTLPYTIERCQYSSTISVNKDGLIRRKGRGIKNTY